MITDLFSRMLLTASSKIERDYLTLETYGGSAIAQERVYCYELYHQLRLLTAPASTFDFGDVEPEEWRLSGEVEKRGYQGYKNAFSPDFIWHVPGQLPGPDDHVLEVKRGGKGSGPGKIRADVEKLVKFRDEVSDGSARYGHASVLVVGQPTWRDSSWDEICDMASGAGINVLHHHTAGHPLEVLTSA